jgi:hypothetical protein
MLGYSPYSILTENYESRPLFSAAVFVEQRQACVGAVEYVGDVAAFGNSQRSSHAGKLTLPLRWDKQNLPKTVPDTVSLTPFLR